MRRAVLQLVGAALVAAALTVGSPAGPPAVAATVTCTGTAKVYDIRDDGSMWLHEHRTPATGTRSWTTGRKIGTGWFGRAFAGPGGRLYLINEAGELRWYRYDGTSWSGPRLVGTGWDRFARSDIEVDASGRIFVGGSTGELLVYRLNESTWTWDLPVVLATKWTYGLAAASGDGVLYGYGPGGTLLRFQYDDTTQSWREFAHQIGSGWFQFRGVSSPGGDVFYAWADSGNLYWYRWNADTQTWANNGAATAIGSGFTYRKAVFASTDTCSVPAPPPPAPTTPLPYQPNDPLIMTALPDRLPKVHYHFLDQAGHAVVAYELVPGELRYTQLGDQVFPGRLTASSNERAVLSAVDANGTVWFNTGDFAWENWSSLGGSMRSAAVVDTYHTVRVVGVDGQGHLWYRRKAQHVERADEFTLWRDYSGPAGLTGQLSAGGGTTFNFYGVAARSDGGVMWFTIDGDNDTYVSGAVPDADQFEFPTAGNNSHRPRMLVARHRNTGQPYALFPEQAGFASTWTPLPDLPVAEGRPMTASDYVIKSSSGSISFRRMIAALGADGLAYVTTESQPNQFYPWRALSTAPAATPPTIIPRGHNAIDVAFRGQDGRLHHYEAQVPPGDTGPPQFTGGPIG